MKRYTIISLFFVCLFSVIVTGSNAQPDSRFVDNQDGTVTDNKTNLMWAKNGWRLDFFSAAKWEDALEKCGTFRLGGYSDWRLPTIKEWKTIIDTKYQFPALTEPNPFQNVICHLAYWSASEYAHGSDQKCDLEGCSRHSYVVLLYFGRVEIQSKVKRAFVWPVRSIKKLARTNMNEHKK